MTGFVKEVIEFSFSSVRHYWTVGFPSYIRLGDLYRGENHHLPLEHGVGIEQLIERQISDQNVVSSNPGRSDGRIFFPRVNFVC